jgi:acyl carrier protein
MPHREQLRGKPDGMVRYSGKVMAMQSADVFEILVKLIKEVKPGLGDQEVKPGESLVDDLGLDSLDLLQLSRKIHREMGVDFSLDDWDEHQDEHHRSVESMLDMITASPSLR